MAKIQIKSEKLTPFGGIFSIMEQFDALLAQTIDSTLGLRCTLFGYQYSEILRSLMCVYLCGGSCIEDISTHLMKHLSLHPTLRTCSADTILRAIEELTCKNTTYKSASGNELFYYTWPKDATHKYEIDFLVSRGSKICPIEVKSSGYKSHASLDAFSEKFSKVILQKYLFYGKDLLKDGNTLLLPFYMTPFV